MGAESSALSGCTLEDPLPEPSSSQAQDWVIHPAKRSDGSKVSVFIHRRNEDVHDERIYEHAAKQLKVLRHPTILKFFASCNNVDSTYLVTEQVKPLELVIETLGPEEICAGMYNVVEALCFLHDRGGVSHNNVCMSSIYVSCNDGGWRLGAMEHLCKYEDATLQFLKQSRPLRNSQAIPPEEKEEGIKTSIGPSIGYSRDVYGFGMLALTLLEYLGDLGSITSSFSTKIEEHFLNPEPKLRPKMSSLLSDEIFKNDFLDIMSFLHKLVLKSEVEKTAFFEGLASHLYRLPAQLVASRLLTPLLSSFVMAEPVAVAMVFPHLLTPRRDSKKNPEFLANRINPILPLDMYQRHMIPILAQVFPSREMHIRSLLLQYFSGYIDLFDEGTLKGTVLPQLLLGLKDHNTNLVADSLRALADLVHLLGPELVVGGTRIKYFVEGRPKFPQKTGKRPSPLTDVPQLTAVSGVITLPAVDPTPIPTPGSQTPRSAFQQKGGVATDQRGVELSESGAVAAVVEDAVVAAAKKAEREKRRDEMRQRNEQRRKEREEKRRQAMEEKEHKERALMSPTGEKLSSLAHRLSPEGSIDNGSFPLGEDASPSKPSPGENSDHSGDEQAVGNLTIDSTEAGDDWSDWEDTGASHQKQPIRSPVTKTSPSETIVKSGAPTETESSRDDWSGDWSQGASDWSSPTAVSSSSKVGKSILKPAADKRTTEQDKPHSSGQAATKTQKTATNFKKPTLAPNQDFGSLYEIPEFKIKPKPTLEDQLFAEMEPSLSFSSSKKPDDARETGSVRTKEGSSQDKEKSSSGLLSMAMAETADEDTAGWGDDDWNLDVDES